MTTTPAVLIPKDCPRKESISTSSFLILSYGKGVGAELCDFKDLDVLKGLREQDWTNEGSKLRVRIAWLTQAAHAGIREQRNVLRNVPLSSNTSFMLINRVKNLK